MVIKIKFEDYARVIITVLIILISGTAIYSIEQFSILRSITLFILLGLLAFEFIINCKLRKRKMFILLMFTMLFFMVLFLRSPSEALGIITKMLLVAFLTNYCYKSNNTYKVFEIIYKCIVVVATISLVFFITLYVLKLNLPNFYIGDNFYKSYFYLFFTQSGYAENIGLFAFCRLQSIFWEPGVFSVYLLLSLYYYCFLANKKKPIHFFVLTISLILTLSTTGLIMGIGLIMVYILQKMESLKARVLTIIPMCIVTIPIMVNIWMKKKNSAISPSYSLRMYDMTRSLEIWKENFWFGVGYNNTSLFSMEGRVGNSNGFLNWCMMTGIVGFIFVIFPFVFNCLISKSKEKIRFLVFGGLFVLMNFTEPLMQTPIMLLLISISYAAMIEKRGLIDGY